MLKVKVSAPQTIYLKAHSENDRFLPPQYFAKKTYLRPRLRRSLSIMQTFDLISRIPIGGLTKSERLSSVQLSTN